MSLYCSPRMKRRFQERARTHQLSTNVQDEMSTTVVDEMSTTVVDGMSTTVVDNSATGFRAR